MTKKPLLKLDLKRLKMLSALAATCLLVYFMVGFVFYGTKRHMRDDEKLTAALQNAKIYTQFVTEKNDVSRGIIMCVHDNESLNDIYATIRLLRHQFNLNWPFEVCLHLLRCFRC